MNLAWKKTSKTPTPVFAPVGENSPRYNCSPIPYSSPAFQSFMSPFFWPAAKRTRQRVFFDVWKCSLRNDYRPWLGHDNRPPYARTYVSFRVKLIISLSDKWLLLKFCTPGFLTPLPEMIFWSFLTSTIAVCARFIVGRRNRAKNSRKKFGLRQGQDSHTKFTTRSFLLEDDLRDARKQTKTCRISAFFIVTWHHLFYTTGTPHFLILRSTLKQ